MDSQEKLLQAWINMSVCIRGNRVLSGLSFNETVVCGLLYHHEKNEGEPVTATDICRHTKLLKSQVNRILTGMEQKGFVERIRSKEDRRKIFVRLSDNNISKYLDEHDKVMGILDAVMDTMGKDKVDKLTELLVEATDIVNSMHIKKDKTSI